MQNALQGVESPAVAPAAIAAALLISPASNGCSRPPGPGAGPEDGPIVMAWKYEAYLGVLAADVEARTKFPIENIGSRSVELEVGMPSCTCEQVDIGKTTLATRGRVRNSA